MKENIVNLFLFVNAGIIREIGAVWHEFIGSDAAKIAHLQLNVESDWRGSRRHKVPSELMVVYLDGKTERGAISYESFVALAETGTQMLILEEAVFRHYSNAPRQPLLVITPVVDGAVKFEALAGPPS